MTAYSISPVRPERWDAFCARQSLFFDSAEWLETLASSFGCRTIYAWNGEDGAGIPVFRAGPFSVAYPGFPAGAITVTSDALDGLLMQLKETGSVNRLTCARLIISGFAASPRIDAPYVTNPETAIMDLQGWDLMGVSKNLRRDIRKAARSGLRVRAVQDASFASSLFGMYAGTVKRHGGSIRYNERYFESLLGLARSGSPVRLFLAESGAEPIGFAVIARHADSAYYLHGGTTPRGRQLSPSDLILSEAIVAARDDGCSMFNFMASPADQPNLVRYKEKWGGETRSQHTCTIGLSAAYPIFRMAEVLYRRVS